MFKRFSLVVFFGLVALVLNAACVLPAFADDSSVLRPPVSTVDLGASRRALRALMNDWEDDEREHAPTRRWLCLNALMSDTGSPLIFPTNDLLWELPKFFTGPNRAPRGTAPVSLRDKLRELATRKEVMPDERDALQRLEARSVEDRLDQIRWVIELQGELMRISDRLYSTRWKALQRYARENPTFLTGADEPVSLCLAAQVRTERNVQLRRAAERILALFDFLELEQDREFGGGGGTAPRG